MSSLQAGEVREDMITPEIKKLLYLSSRMKLKKAEAQILDEEDIKKQVEDKLVGRLLDPTSVLRLSRQNKLEDKPYDIESADDKDKQAKMLTQEVKERRRSLNK